MILQDKRLLGSAAGVALIAALGGFAVARYTTGGSKPVEAPASVPAAASGKEKKPDTLAMTAQAMQQASIATETVKAGGLGAEIVSQATVAASPTGEAIVTARAGGAVTRLLKRLGDPVRAGEALAIVESREAAQFAADRTVAAAKSALAQKALAREQYLYRQKEIGRAHV